MKKMFFISAILGLLLLSGCSKAKEESFDVSWKTDGSTLSDEKKALIDETLKNYIFSGNVMVALDGQTVYETSSGFADKAKDISITNDSVFEIGSITKQFTAAAIMMLFEQDKLDINDTLSTYYPDIPNSDKITLRNLLNMDSGIPNYLETIGYNNMLVDNASLLSYDIDKNGLIDLFINTPSGFEPGAKFEYSNTNYYLLGLIIEKVSGTTYEEYITKNIFEPLDMSDSTFDISNISTKGYDMNGNEEVLPTPDMMFSAGQICSTTKDLNKWINSLFTKKVINDSSLVQMFKDVNGYGFGWYIDDSLYTHGGTTISYGSSINVDTANNITVIVLTNIQNNNIAMTIANDLSSTLAE